MNLLAKYHEVQELRRAAEKLSFERLSTKDPKVREAWELHNSKAAEFENDLQDASTLSISHEPERLEVRIFGRVFASEYGDATASHFDDYQRWLAISAGIAAYLQKLYDDAAMDRDAGIRENPHITGSIR